MAKWELVIGEDSVIDLLRNRVKVGSIRPTAGELNSVDKEIARKLNAFDEMLEALKEFVQSFGWEYPNSTKQAEAAITKAEGN